MIFYIFILYIYYKKGNFRNFYLLTHHIKKKYYYSGIFESLMTKPQGKPIQVHYSKFPFDELRLDPIINNGMSLKISDYGDIHLKTFLFNADSQIYSNYTILYDRMLAPSITYMGVDKNGKPIMNPQFYMHPILHPKYTEKDDNDCIKKLESVTGKKMEAFFDKIVLRIEELINECNPKIKVLILGSRNANKKNGFIKEIYDFPEDKNKNPNTNLSKVFATRLWTFDPSKDPTREQTGRPSDSIAIPGKNYHLLPKIYDLTQNLNNKSPLTKYDQLLNPTPFIYGKKSDPNSSFKRHLLDVIIEVMGFTLHGKPGDEKRYDLQQTIKSLKICRAREIHVNNDLTEKDIQDCIEQDDRVNDEFGDVFKSKEEVVKDNNLFNAYSQYINGDSTNQLPDSPNTQAINQENEQLDDAEKEFAFNNDNHIITEEPYPTQNKRKNEFTTPHPDEITKKRKIIKK